MSSHQYTQLEPKSANSDSHSLLEHDNDSEFEFEPPFTLELSQTIYKHESQMDASLSLSSGISLIVGVTIGSGIFASPGPVYLHTKSIGASLVVWVLAGLLSMTGALCYSG